MGPAVERKHAKSLRRVEQAQRLRYVRPQTVLKKERRSLAGFAIVKRKAVSLKLCH
jgi:hypothetical protein